ncbi:MAG: polyamine aminopropyltransferase [Gammaproteobacteria bacterium]|nr:polyamine aminopropyltransferase [Gammaproteobacteria bacterium]
MKHFKETLYDSVCQEYRIDKLYFESKTEHQHLMIFHNAQLGRVMTLDGIVQTTEADEFIYHEMLTHVPMLAHGAAKRVLIIGGGDGGMLREAIKHPIEHITQVEIDEAVVEMAIKYLPNHSAGAYNDKRLNLVIDDGIEFVKNTDEKFDVIISDSTDPIGPGEVLFTDNFYAQAKRCLNPGGILVTQNGVPFFQKDEVKTTFQRMGQQFADMGFYCAPIPTYYGGFMTFAWGTDNNDARDKPLAEISQQFEQLNIKTRYYNPAIHQASFALPQYILDALKPTS